MRTRKILSVLLSILIVVGFIYPIKTNAAGSTVNRTVTVKDARDSSISVSVGKDAGVAQMLIFGIYGSNASTNTAVNTMSNIIPSIGKDNLRVIYFSAASEDTSTIASLTSSVSKDIIVADCNVANYTSPYYYLFYDCYLGAGGTGISYPFIVYLDSSGNIFDYSNGSVGENKIKATLTNMGLFSYEYHDSTISISGEKDYKIAYELLDELNSYRKKLGLSEVKMDKDLLEAAMLRSFEIDVLFEHARPNGMDCFSVCSKADAENIAAGYQTVQAVMTAWDNSLGHKRNMTDPSMVSVGIGVVRINGRLYWTQLFGKDFATTTTKRTDCVSVTQNVDIISYMVNVSFSQAYTINLFDAPLNPVIKIGSVSSTDLGDYTLSSSDPNVFVIDSNNQIVAKNPGTADLNLIKDGKVVATTTVTVVHVHKGIYHAAVSTTCTKDGNRFYYECACGLKFAESSCKTLLTDVVVPAQGHDFSQLMYDGTNHWYKCIRCTEKTGVTNHTWNYPEATEEHDKRCIECNYLAQEKLTHVHKGVFVSGLNATCTTIGYLDYYTCSCGLKFSDSDCTIELTDITIPATGHEYETIWSKNATNHWYKCTKCTATTGLASHTWNYSEATEEHDKHCIVCGYVAQEQLLHTHNVTYISPVAVTCTTNGTKAYYGCTCGQCFEDVSCTKLITDIDTWKVIPATGHNPGAEATCTVPQTCQTCGATIAPKKGHSYSTEWYSNSQQHWHKCVTCGQLSSVSNHAWNYSSATEEHDKHCTVCGYVSQNKLPHTHKGTYVAGTPATCETAGTKSFYSCSCGLKFSDSTCKNQIADLVIPKTGHKPGAAATATTPQTCTVCNAVISPATGGSSNNGGSGSTTNTPTTSPGVTPVKPTVTPAVPTVTPVNPTVTPVTETGLEGFIERLYNVALGRQSESEGKNWWINKVTYEGFTGSDVANGFLVSYEFLGKQMSNSDFLEVLYKTFFDRASDAQGKAYWLNQMNSGYSKTDVINGFCNSTEWANLCLTYGIPSGSSATPTIVITPNEGTNAFVTRLYTTCLGRTPEQGGFQYWTYRLANLQERGYSAAYGFFTSTEFTSKGYDNATYVTLLYRTILGREPDQAGLNYWLGLMANGMSRVDVLNGFAASDEWAQICTSYGILR